MRKVKEISGLLSVGSRGKTSSGCCKQVPFVLSEGLNYGQFLIYLKELNWSEILVLPLVGLHEHHAMQSGFRLPAQNLL